MAEFHGRFVWYELLTTDGTAAKAFYTKVMDWEAEDESTPDLAYTLFSAATVAVGGLMELPEDARKMGATPRWMGYVSVADVNAAADRLRRLGGSVYVPPTDSNIGRIAVVADPQTATLALVEGLKSSKQQAAAPGKPGHVGWHELLAADRDKAMTFYGELFGWQKADAEVNQAKPYQQFSIGGRTIGGIFTKTPMDPMPYWHFYLDVSDVDAAAERVKAAGGRIFEGPLEVPGDSWIVRCADPQGAAFALQGKRGQNGIGWSAEWDGFSSRGRLLK
jgi:predicted enzyme related to lactoylglutathione lyase